MSVACTAELDPCAEMRLKMDTDKRERPHWGRWLKAAFGAWFAAPLFAPFMWRFLIIEGVDVQAIFIVGFWTYFLGLPIASIGIVALVFVSLVWFDRVSAWHWWKWALSGAAIGLAIMSVIFRLDIRNFPLDEPGLLLVASGPMPGLAAALIFRRLLLGGPIK